MAIDIAEAIQLRRALSGASRTQYEEMRRRFIGINEESSPNGKPACYTDSKGCHTVGVGFNMDRDGARKEWKAAFAALPAAERPDFDKVRGQTATLNQEQINTLFNHAANTREQELKHLYTPATWDALKPNERLAVEDIYYNGGQTLAGKGTYFYENIQRYAETKDKSHLERALWEIAHNSNASKRKGKADAEGIQNRRNAQAAMLNSYDANIETLSTPNYSKETHDRVARRKEGKKLSLSPQELDQLHDIGTTLLALAGSPTAASTEATNTPNVPAKSHAPSRA